MINKITLDPSLLKAGNYLTQGLFKIQSFQEASCVSFFLAESCPNSRLAEISLCELFTNAIEHGNLNISSEEKDILQNTGKWMEEIERRLKLPENKNKWVEIKIKRSMDELKITVKDQGTGFNWRKYQKEIEERHEETHGRGILMAKTLIFKELIYSDTGNEVTAVIDLLNNTRY
jgi:anti-sigma regulatory factor (Ser/Thr protein kinase)